MQGVSETYRGWMKEPRRQPPVLMAADCTGRLHSMKGSSAVQAMVPVAPMRRGSARHVQDGVRILLGLAQHGDRLRRGQYNEVDVPTACFFLDLTHDRQ